MDSSPPPTTLSNTQILLFIAVHYLLLSIIWYVYWYMARIRYDIEVSRYSELKLADHIFLCLPFTWHRPTELTRHALYLGELHLNRRLQRAIADFGPDNQQPVIRPLEDFLKLARRPNASPDQAQGESEPLADGIGVPLYRRTYYKNRDPNLRLKSETEVILARRFATTITRQYPPYNALLNNGEMYIDLLKTGVFSKATSLDLVNRLVSCLAILTLCLFPLSWILLCTSVAAIGVVLFLLPLLILLIYIFSAIQRGGKLFRHLQHIIIDILNGTSPSVDLNVVIDNTDKAKLSAAVSDIWKPPEQQTEAAAPSQPDATGERQATVQSLASPTPANNADQEPATNND